MGEGEWVGLVVGVGRSAKEIALWWSVGKGVMVRYMED